MDYQMLLARVVVGLGLLGFLLLLILFPLYVGVGYLVLTWLLWSPMVLNIGHDPYIGLFYAGMPVVIPLLMGYFVVTGRFGAGPM